ncbi:Nuclear pore complex protein Nup85 [Grifola frondosa]|uniref:Nuclear pore complex protein Nup85 n=1 Tax=Grifola frondosa TaxID=5627 RepID=A0A1C7LPY0_GRIFR|nr:Nuclear pore complex protein Nup85 [Grifola frondosa]
MTSKHYATLVPPLFAHGGVDDFKQSGRTLQSSLSPRDRSIAVCVSPNADPQVLRSQNASYPKVVPIYFASPERAPTSERRTVCNLLPFHYAIPHYLQFLSDTFVIFEAMRNLKNMSRFNDPHLLESDEGRHAIRKLGNDYVNFCKECCLYASADMKQNITRPEPLQFSAEHYRRLYTCFSLSTIGGFPVGDELMDWINNHFIEPSTEEGDRLSSEDRPWEDPAFWPYLTRTTLRGLSKASSFFLNVLSDNHPSQNLQELSRNLCPLVADYPRLQNFSTEREFAKAFRRWRDKVKMLRIALDRVPDDDREDGFDNWWDRLSDVIGILEGREDIIKRICLDQGQIGRKFVLCGVYLSIPGYDDEIYRDYWVPSEVVTHILDEMPSDPTDHEDMIQTSLFLGKPVQALSEAAQMDIWLAAHVADMMECLDLFDADEFDDSELSLRDQYIIDYAEHLRTDPALWRLTVDYMYSCGPVGIEMADQVLMHVPLRLRPAKNEPTVADDNAKIRAGAVVGVLKEISQTCFDYQREGVRRMVCRVAAQTFIQEKEYALAVSYCVSAEDWPGLGHVVDRVLDEYIARGPEQFARLVANIAPTLHSLRADTGAGAHEVFVYRLAFAVRFAEFHRRRINGELQDAATDVVAMFREEVAPKSWWAVLLCDAVELLQYGGGMLFAPHDACLLIHKLEEIHVRTAQGAKEDYLAILAKLSKGGDKHALQRLQVVRLALVKYYARCGVVGVGGKNVSPVVY